MRTRNWIWVGILISIFFLPGFASAQEDTLILLGSNSEMYHICAVSAYNKYAFAADRDWGLRVINYSDPYNPYSVIRYPEWAMDIEIKDSLAYIGGLSFYIIDISNPLEPAEVGSCGNWHDLTFRVHLFDTLALAMHHTSLGECVLEIIDISDPTNPQILSSSWGGPHGLMDAWKKDNYVYWVDEWGIGGIVKVLDITDPTEPIPIAETYLPSRPHGIWIKDNHAYVALTNWYVDHGGLMVLDISDPYNIDSVGFFEIPEGTVYNVYIKGNLAYVSAQVGVYVLDIADATNPSLVTYYDTPGIPRDVFVDEPYVLVADYTSLLVFEASFLSDIPGDVNSDREVNISDVIYLINYLFANGPEPPIPNLADVNSDCQINISDVVYLINYLFVGGPSPQFGCVS